VPVDQIVAQSARPGVPAGRGNGGAPGACRRGSPGVAIRRPGRDGGWACHWFSPGLLAWSSPASG